jgi:phospholipase C
MVQENRSFDNYFGKLNDYRVAKGLPADVDGLPADASNPSADGTTTVSAFHLLTMCTENSSPFWNESHRDFNRNDPTSSTGLMNGYVYTAAEFAQANNFYDTSGLRVMGYYDQDDIPYYYFLAGQFGISDRWFSPVPTNSAANHLYLFSGTSAGHVRPPVTPLQNKTIFQLLEENGHTWKIYETDDNVTFLSYFQPFAKQHESNVVPVSQFFDDLANDTLPEVALIEAGLETGEDEHPGTNIQTGSTQVANLIDSLMNSPAWSSSVFLLTWDEGGGLYDHVPFQPAINPDGILPVDLLPTDNCYGLPCADFTETGSRVPLLVISPFAKREYVSHNVADYTAILKFIETRFNLPSLTKRDAAQPDMMDFFDFANPPNLHPPQPPVQPQNGPCYYDHLP